MAKTIVLVDGALAYDSILRVQLGLKSLFEFRVGEKNYQERLENTLNIKDWRVEFVNINYLQMTVGELKNWLSEKIPDFRQYGNFILYRATLFVQNEKELVQLIQRSEGNEDLVQLADSQELMSIPVGLLDDARLEGRSLSSLEAKYTWTLSSPVYHLDQAAELFEVWRLSTNSRHFNTFSVDGAYLVKKSSMSEKNSNEFEFLDRAPTPVKPYFPQVGRLDKGAYAIEYVPHFDAARHMIHGHLSEVDFTRLLKSVGGFLAAREKIPAEKPQEASTVLRALFVDKVNVRCADFLKSENGLKLEAPLAALWPGGLPAFHATLAKALAEKLPAWSKRGLRFSHGDLCLSNILFDRVSGAIKLIDPRGGASVDASFMPPIYDLAKMSHSLLGWYELITNGIYTVSLDDQIKPTVGFGLASEYLNSAAAVFKKWLKSNSEIALSDVRLAEASLFLSMLPLHQDRPRHQLVMFHQANAAYRASQESGS